MIAEINQVPPWPSCHSRASPPTPPFPRCSFTIQLCEQLFFRGGKKKTQKTEPKSQVLLFVHARLASFRPAVSVFLRPVQPRSGTCLDGDE